MVARADGVELPVSAIAVDFADHQSGLDGEFLAQVKPQDLRASAFLLGANGKVRRDEDFIFYGNLKSTDGSVLHTGDNLTGAGEGDDEVLIIDFTKVPPDVQKIAITVTIYEAEDEVLVPADLSVGPQEESGGVQVEIVAPLVLLPIWNCANITSLKIMTA